MAGMAPKIRRGAVVADATPKAFDPRLNPEGLPTPADAAASGSDTDDDTASYYSDASAQTRSPARSRSSAAGSSRSAYSYRSGTSKASKRSDKSRSSASRSSAGSRGSRAGSKGADDAGSEYSYQYYTGSEDGSSASTTSSVRERRVKLVICSKKELRTRERGRNKSRLNAVLRIQRMYRAWVVRQELAERQYAAEDIQAIFRGYVARRNYTVVQRHVVVMERHMRGWLARRWFRPALAEYRKQIRSVMRVQALWRGRELRHEARIRESEWLMSRLAPAAAQSQRRRLERKSGSRPKTPPGVKAAREMVERQAEEQWLELCSLKAAAAAADREDGATDDIEYHRFCFSRIGWCGRMQTFPPQCVHIATTRPIASYESRYVVETITAHQNIWHRLRPEERCAVLEMTQSELKMLAENEWRLNGDRDAARPWHMPAETLQCVEDPDFCRGVQQVFVQAIEGNGTALIPAHLLYRPEQQYSSIIRGVQHMQRQEAETRFRFPWKMPFALREECDLATTVRRQQIASTQTEDCQQKTGESDLYLYCMRCTKYRSEGEFFQYNIKHATRYCNRKDCDACRVPQLQLCWFCAMEDAVTHDAEEADSTARLCGVVHWMLHVIDERLHAAVGETHDQLDFLLGRGAVTLMAAPSENFIGIDDGFCRIYRQQHLFGHQHIEKSPVVPPAQANAEEDGLRLPDINLKSGGGLQDDGGDALQLRVGQERSFDDVMVLAKAKKFSTALAACEDYVRTGTQSALAARLEKEKAQGDGGGKIKKSKEQLAREALAGFQHAQRKKPLPGFITRDTTSSFVPGSVNWSRLRTSK